MRLDWNDIRARAARFADEWKEAHYERGETQTFYNEFFELFGVTRRRVASFEHGVELPENRRGYLDLFWKGKLLIEQKSKGRNLKPARKQALNYFPGLKEQELPRYILLSDFQSFELYDLDIDPENPIKFRLDQLPDHVQAFGFIVGQERRIFRDQDPANIQASEIMGTLHDALEASGYIGHDLERFLVRLLFCLFADDTGIFYPADIFEQYVSNTREDGADLGPALGALFQVLDTDEDQRATTLSAELSQFPYINGDLFTETLRLPSFDRGMRERLIAACGFKWELISPAIFGSLFQSVMDKAERRKSGGHYTSEKNILKVIEPLFMDDLWAEFERLKIRRDTGRSRALEKFHNKIAGLTFFDPACGCGNFLVIAYRELRELEIAVLRARFEQRFNRPGLTRAEYDFDVASLSKINVDQFYGIEIKEFPVRIAEVAMWMTDHIMNVRLSLAFGKSYARIPLKVSPNIRHADALEIDWADVLAPNECSYIFGNPPFIGFVMRGASQQVQTTELMKRLGAKGTRLDYVAAWFLKAAEYLQNSRARIGFVATNSITQGEQVAQLWPALFERYKLEIAFAHRTFAWESDARGKARVHCVIIGLTRRDDELAEKRLFSYRDYSSDPDETQHKVLSPYLFDASRLNNRYLVVSRTGEPAPGMPEIRVGSKPVDGGYFIMTSSERSEIVQKEPDAASLIRPFVGTDELVNGGDRWILTLHRVSPSRIRSMPALVKLIEKVRLYRLGELPPRKSPDGENNKASALSLMLAKAPTEFHVTVLPQKSFLAIPEVSSERREYLPIAWLDPPAIPSNKLLVAFDAQLFHFALLVSRMHLAWAAFVGGRLESRYQYSPGMNYNPFPWPTLTQANEQRLARLAQQVLDARARHADSTLADIYDPKTMPLDLRKAHRALDEAVDRLYRKEPFKSDRERVEHLFTLYEKMTAPMLAAVNSPKKRLRRGFKSKSEAAQGLG